MKLYLLRHGDALSQLDDPRCPLSPEGRYRVEKIAEFLTRARVSVDKIECSKKTRAMETAAIIADAIHRRGKVIQRDGLNPNDSLVPVLEELAESTGDRMLVGHLPYMENMASTLLVGSPAGLKIRFSTATLVCLGRRGEGSWNLAWMINPEMI